MPWLFKNKAERTRALDTQLNQGLFRAGLSTYILVGLVLGGACGLFFGEYCGWLRFFGDAFVMLLQMTVLPYIVFSLMAGIGRLTYNEGKLLAQRGVILIGLYWLMGLCLVAAVALVFPAWQTSSFFSASLVPATEPINFLKLYIPANPFQSLSQNVVPAVVVFSFSIGIALIGLPEKNSLIEPLEVLSAALIRVARFVVHLTPLGVFALTASAFSGTSLTDVGQLQAFFLAYIAAALLLTFWLLPVFAVLTTPFKLKEIFYQAKDALIMAYTIGNLFVVLPVIAQNCRELYLEHSGGDKKGQIAASTIDVVLLVAFIAPHLGKLIILLFIAFAAWFSGNRMDLWDYPFFLLAGLFNLFSTLDQAIPRLLDLFRIPADYFELYQVTAIVTKKVASLVGAMHLSTFALIVVSATTGMITITKRKSVGYIVTSLFIVVGVIAGAHLYLNHYIKGLDASRNALTGLQLQRATKEAVVHKTAPLTPAKVLPNQPPLDRIVQRGVLKVGYHPDQLPFSYFNAEGALVGFDVDLAHSLAADLNVDLEFYPFAFDTLARQLKANDFDIAMAGVPKVPGLISQVAFSNSYLDLTYALVVRDHQRKEYSSIDALRGIDGLTMGILEESLPGNVRHLRMLPDSHLVRLTTYREFFAHDREDVDVLIISAEAGSAWTLLYPHYQVIIPDGLRSRLPIGYAMAGLDVEMQSFINTWIELKTKDKTIEALYNYWILGRAPQAAKRPWSVIRNVLGWVE